MELNMAFMFIAAMGILWTCSSGRLLDFGDTFALFLPLSVEIVFCYFFVALLP
jgi:low affinity Fe/Cu permease